MRITAIRATPVLIPLEAPSHGSAALIEAMAGRLLGRGPIDLAGAEAAVRPFSRGVESIAPFGVIAALGRGRDGAVGSARNALGPVGGRAPGRHPPAPDPVHRLFRLSRGRRGRRRRAERGRGRGLLRRPARGAWHAALRGASLRPGPDGEHPPGAGRARGAGRGRADSDRFEPGLLGAGAGAGGGAAGGHLRGVRRAQRRGPGRGLGGNGAAAWVHAHPVLLARCRSARGRAARRAGCDRGQRRRARRSRASDALRLGGTSAYPRAESVAAAHAAPGCDRRRAVPAAGEPGRPARGAGAWRRARPRAPRPMRPAPCRAWPARHVPPDKYRDPARPGMHRRMPLV